MTASLAKARGERKRDHAVYEVMKSRKSVEERAEGGAMDQDVRDSALSVYFKLESTTEGPKN